MKRWVHKESRLLAALLLVASIVAPAPAVFGQSQGSVAPTKIVYHKNNYSPADDVKVGRQAAAEAERQLRIIRDPEASAYLESLGQRLVAAIPPEFQHPEFRYYFRLVDNRQINAFALPGGPMYVNSGVILVARNEGELAGVMAHELSHVALRHGTAQATKAQSPSLLAGLGAIGGAILGGPLGQAVYAGSQLGAAGYLLRFSREYETEADLLGSRIMARAGYDPRDLANMFQTIAAQGGGGGGGFFSDHPSPKNRYARINEEATRLPLSANPIKVTPEFRGIQEWLRGNGRAYPSARNNYPRNNYPNNYPNDPRNNYPNNYPNDPRDNYPPDSRVGRVDYPSARSRSYSEFNVLRLEVPENWRELSEQGSSVWFAPQGGYGTTNGNAVYTHGVNLGVTRSNSSNLQQATDEFVTELQRSNQNLRSRSGYQRTSIDGRNAMSLALGNINEATGQREIVNVVTTQLRNGDLLYLITVAPESDYYSYQNSFQRILQSVRFND
jgi:beta-barrel assembly-enhancing protease